MAGIVVELLRHSWPSVQRFGVGFLFSRAWNPVTQEFGAASSIFGTLVSTAIAMVVIGGTNLMGGRGGIGLTLIGTLTIGYLEKILSINAVPEAGRLMLTGVIIVAAVLAQGRQRW